MQRFEYRVIPAPTKGKRGPGLRSAEARFANTVEQLLNEMAAEGWTYDRAEYLPSEERSGLTGTAKNWRNLLVFKRLAEEQPERATDEPEDTTEAENDQPTPEIAAEEPKIIPMTRES